MTGIGVQRSLSDGAEIVLPRWRMRVALRADETAGAMTLVDNVMQPGHLGPPQHVHDGHDEAFLLTSGRLRFRIGETFVTGEPGQVVYAGRGLAHGFANPFDEPNAAAVRAAADLVIRPTADAWQAISPAQRRAP